MKKTVKLFLLMFSIVLQLTSCNSNSPSKELIESNNVPSPFSQFEKLKKSEEMGIDKEQVENLLRSYGVYEKILEKITEAGYDGAYYSDVSIGGFNSGDKKIAVLQIEMVHLYFYVMFSNSNNSWSCDGLAYINDRYVPEYRIEQSDDQTEYWLVVRYEANHGTGLQINNEIWFNPDGAVAADYPIDGFTEFFPQMIEPSANAKFSAFAEFDGNSRIHIYYTINFIYNYKDSIQNKDYIYRFKSDYSPVIRENWEYDLETKQFRFISSDPDLPDSFKSLKHELSADLGILQGYVDFYRNKLQDKISTLEEWEKFIGQK